MHFSAAVAALALVVTIGAGPAAAQTVDELSRRQALDRYRAGQEFMSSEKYADAAEEFSAATRLDPLLALAHYGRGQAYMALKRYASAIQAYAGCREAYERLGSLRQTNKIESDRQMDDQIRALQESLNATRTGQVKGQGETSALAFNLEKQLDDLKRLRQERDRTDRSPVPAEVSLALGSAYYRNAQATDAEREWLEAVRANARLGEAHNNLAVLYMQSGRKKEAEDAVKAAEKARFRVHPQLKADIQKMK